MLQLQTGKRLSDSQGRPSVVPIDRHRVHGHAMPEVYPRMIFLGIDPGLSGALAILSEVQVGEGAVGQVPPKWRIETVARVFDTPSCTIARNGKNRSEYLIENMRDILMHEAHGDCESFAVLEAVHSMPGQGVSSSFSFGRGLGIWEGLLVGCGIPYAKIAPQTWKKAMMPDMDKSSKDSSRLAAMRLFPQLSDKLSRKKDDGRAEALLLAEYGRRLKR
jgi:crossover junction endodeoxyribonuclease RuvC